MIFRVLANKELYEIDIPQNEESFLKLQAKGKLKFLQIPENELPTFKSPIDYDKVKVFYKLGDDGKVKIDLNRTKPSLIKVLNIKATKFIEGKLRSLDWGDSYEECLAELNSSAEVFETKILYLLKPHKPDLTLTEIRQKIAEYLAGTYSAEDAQRELQELGLSEEEIHKYLSLLGYAVEVAKLLYWVEEVWDYVEQKEKEIFQASTLEELEQIENKYPELE